VVEHLCAWCQRQNPDGPHQLYEPTTSPRSSFCATLGEEPEVEVALLKQIGARVLLTALRASRILESMLGRGHRTLGWAAATPTASSIGC
jgi:hypothetical protein